MEPRPARKRGDVMAETQLLFRKAEVPEHVPPENVIDFDLFAQPSADTDFFEYWKRLQAPGVPDFVWTPCNGGHWIATRGEDIHTIYADHDRFSSRNILLPAERNEAIRVLPTSLDPPEHRPFRSLINHALSPKVVRGLEPSIRELTVSLIEGFRQRGHCEFASEFAELLPISLFLKMVNLPVEDRLKLKALSEQVNRPDGSMTPEEVNQGFYDYLMPVLLERRANPGDDIFSQFLAGSIDGRPMTDAEAFELCMQVLIAGLDTVVSVLGFLMMFLARNAEHRQLLVDDPARIPPAVKEFLRRFPLVAIPRTVIHDMEFQGVRFKEGDLILVPTMLHGLDDRAYQCPLEVDFERRIGIHSTFGAGVHRCPGSLLARAELRIFLEEWLSRIPRFDIEPGRTPKVLYGIVGTVVDLPLVWQV
ncbi:MAG: cytochrome P450 [Alphaproteobacteria bacterium]|nr:cytochrome P450 [Alphaproteobacteria bacterium]